MQSAQDGCVLLTFNAGSSSIKLGLFALARGAPRRIGGGMVDLRHVPLVLESMAAVSILRAHLPELKIRVVNVVDPIWLQSDSDKPIVFAFHGYREEGTITTAFEVRVQNGLDCFHLVQNAVDWLPQLAARGDCLKHTVRDKLVGHKIYID